MNYSYDATSDKCPLPLVKLRVMLRKMQQGDACVIRILDKGSKKDIPKLLHKYGYEFQCHEVDRNVWELHIPYKALN